VLSGGLFGRYSLKFVCLAILGYVLYVNFYFSFISDQILVVSFFLSRNLYRGCSACMALSSMIILLTSLQYLWQPIWLSGLYTRLLRNIPRVRSSHSTNICVYEHVCLYWVLVFSILIRMYLQKKIISIYSSLSAY
jgi:hypothetical protein